MSDPSEPDSIHTSCRSESSNKSLVVLDKDDLSRKPTDEPNVSTPHADNTGPYYYDWTIMWGEMKTTAP